MAVIADLQEKIDKIAGGCARERPRLAFGLPEIDERIHGGLALASTHEIADGGGDSVNGAAAVLFAAGIAELAGRPVSAASSAMTFLRRHWHKGAWI